MNLHFLVLLLSIGNVQLILYAPEVETVDLSKMIHLKPY